MSIEMPETVKKAHREWAEELRKRLKRGDLIIVDWGDAADEKQVVVVKKEKVATPVRTIGFFYDVVDTPLGPHLVLVGHIFSDKWKDMTYIPIGWIHQVEVREDGLRQRLVSERTWKSHAHTRKTLIGRRTRANHLSKLVKAIGGEKLDG